LASRDFWAKLTSHPLLFGGIAVLIAAASVFGAYSWNQLNPPTNPGSVITPCGTCPDACNGVDFLLVEQGGNGMLPAHAALGSQNWYNYSIIACDSWTIGDLYFGVDDNRTCEPLAQVVGVAIFTAPGSWNLEENASNGWWNVNTSATIPVTANPGNLSVATNAPLTEAILTVYWVGSTGQSLDIYSRGMAQGVSSSCYPSHS